MCNRHVHACFICRNIPCHCDISGINLKQWSHYNDVTESQVVIHITVNYRSLSDTLSTRPFDLLLRCAFGVRGLGSFPVWAQLELSFGFQITLKNNNIKYYNTSNLFAHAQLV